MIREIERKPIKYEEYWVLRGIDDTGNKKQVFAEREFVTPPTEQDIVDFLMTTKCSFVSLEHNYRLVKIIDW